MRTRSSWIVLAAAMAAHPVAALAEEEPAQVQEGLEEPGLQEKARKAEKVEPADPDPALNTKVEARRREIQDLLNKFQEEVGNKSGDLIAKDAKDWDKIIKAADGLVQGFLADNEKYLESHRALLDTFQAAHGAGKAEEASKAGKEVVKLRMGLLAKLDKLSKSADKVKGEWAKLQERIQKNAGK